MKQLMNYEACEIEILPLTDIVTSSGGFDGDEDEFDFGFGKNKIGNEYDIIEWKR